VPFIYLYDRQSSETSVIPRGTPAIPHAYPYAAHPSLSGDGRYVAFDAIDRLVSADTNITPDVYVYDRLAGTFTLISAGIGGVVSNEQSVHPSISNDGRYVSFESRATNLVPGDTTGEDVFVHDRQTGQTTQISEPVPGFRRHVVTSSISGNGRFVAYTLYWPTFPGLIYVRDRDSGQVRLISLALDGSNLPNAVSLSPTVSADGQVIAFSSAASDLVAGDTNGQDDIFVAPVTPPNQRPVVSAGPDRTLAFPTAATLDGAVTDDGLPFPPGRVTVSWTKVSGPGFATFANASVVDTTVTFSQAGTYVLRLTANDGELQASDDVTIASHTVPTITLQPMNQTVIRGQDAVFRVAATGVPQPTYEWQALIGSSWFAIASTGNHSGTATPTLTVATAVCCFHTQYRCVVRNSFGSVTSNAAELTVTDQRPIEGDHNGDGRADLLWRHTAGEMAIWLMNGGQSVGGGGVATVDPTWQIVGNGDYNGDVRADVLWRHSSGTVVIWFMNGTQTLGGGTVATVDPAWKIVGTGDYNSDRKADILWRHTSGAVTIWFMNGVLISGSAALPTVEPAWQIVGTGDHNGDGRADILWRHISGQAAIWLMNGPQVLGGGGFTTVDPSWRIVGTGDYDGDSRADILWRHNSGQAAIWLMNSTQVLGGGGFTTVDTAWVIVGRGDYNGDGKADILWRHTSGQVAMWFMNGLQALSGAGVTTMAPAWQIVDTGQAK
jgi:hypothetical protein